MHFLRIFLLVGALLLCIPRTTPVAKAVPPVVLDRLPNGDFSLPDLEGGLHGLKSQKGKVVLLNFWATWCGPCRVEMPRLNAIYEKLKNRNFTFYAINVDSYQTVANVKPFFKSTGFTFPVLMDTDYSVVNTLNPSGTVPFTIVIDQSGAVRHVHPGYGPGEELKVEREIRQLLEANGGESKAASSDAKTK